VSKEVAQAITASKDFAGNAFDTAQADLIVATSRRDKTFFLARPFKIRAQNSDIEEATEKMTAAQKRARTLSVIEDLDFQKPESAEEGWTINLTVRGNRINIREDVWYLEYKIGETTGSVRNVRHLGTINDERIPEDDAETLFKMYQPIVSEIAAKADEISRNKTMQT